jgi:signal recognition particle subunit SRP54
MFEALSKGFRAARNRLIGVAEITEENIDQALRDVRLSLLEADVELNVTKRFLERVKEKAVGEVIKTQVRVKDKKLKIGPGERFVKICQDELERLMVGEGPAVQYAPRPALTTIMMVGLQGSGKTTTAAKLARFLTTKDGRKVLLVAADVQRPGAIEQLQVLGKSIHIPVFSIPGGNPVEICRQSHGQARKLKCDTVIIDTAGRLAIDEPLMAELGEIKTKTKPSNIFLVIDAMIGQDAVQTSSAFHQRLQLTGAVLTKLDGDARGGAALSVREVTGAPIRFAGIGETLDGLEEFRPKGMASRILGMGDVVGLMKDFEEVVDEEKAEAGAKKMLKGQFTLDDFLEQIAVLQQMGSLKNMFEKLPFFSESVPENFRFDERDLGKIKAVVSSMTKAERRDTELFRRHPQRIKRVAQGSGRQEKDVGELLQRFEFMRQMMSQIGEQASILQKMPGIRQMAMARRLKEAVKTGGLEDNPMMANLADNLLEAAVAGDGPMGAVPRPPKSKLNRQNKRKQRKLQRKARKKSRK